MLEPADVGRAGELERLDRLRVAGIAPGARVAVHRLDLREVHRAAAVGLVRSAPPAAIPRLDDRTLDDLRRMQTLLPAGLGLNLRVDACPDGAFVTVTGNANGQGCLMRFRPASGTGVVVLFNSESGDEAARRIAHLALGGE